MVKYADYRDQISSGDVLAWSHRKLESFYDLKVWLVRILTASEYSHVGIAWVFGGRVFVIESVTPEVRIVPLSNLLPCYVSKVKRINWNNEAEDFALSLVGKGKYSQWEAVKAYFNENKDPDAWECAEFVKVVLDKSGVKLNGRAVPSDVVYAVQQRGGETYLLEN